MLDRNAREYAGALHWRSRGALKVWSLWLRLRSA